MIVFTGFSGKNSLLTRIRLCFILELFKEYKLSLTVGQLRQILSDFSDDTQVEILESHYNGSENDYNEESPNVYLVHPESLTSGYRDNPKDYLDPKILIFANWQMDYIEWQYTRNELLNLLDK